MSGRVYFEVVNIGTVQVFQLAVEDPTGTLSANVGDLGIYAPNGVVWQCKGGTNWVSMNGQDSNLFIGAFQQSGEVMPGSFTLVSSGIMDAPTLVASASLRSVDAAGGVFVEQGTSGVLNDDAYAASPIFGIVSQTRPYAVIDFALPVLTSIRFVAGICNAGLPAVFASDDPVAGQALLQFSTSRPDVSFQFAQRGAGAQVLTDTGIVPVAGRRYTLIVDAPELEGASYRERLILIDRTTNAFSAVVTNSGASESIGTIPTSIFAGLEAQVGAVRTIYQYGLKLTLRGNAAVPT